jgi:hypothetical protein
VRHPTRPRAGLIALLAMACLSIPTPARALDPVGPYLNLGAPSWVALQLGLQGAWCERCAAGYALSGELGLGGVKADATLTTGKLGRHDRSYFLWGVGPAWMYSFGVPMWPSLTGRHHAGGEITFNVLDRSDSQGTELLKATLGYLTTCDAGERGHMVVATVGLNLAVVLGILSYRPAALGP